MQFSSLSGLGYTDFGAKLFLVACVASSLFASALAAPEFPSVPDLKKSAVNLPQKDKCLFYTSRLSEQARNYAKTAGKTTIWDVWPASYYDPTKWPQNTYKTDGERRQYFKTMSRAYAQLCSGASWVMIPGDTKPCSDSIWVEDEYDAISKGETGVTKVTRIDTDGTDKGDYAEHAMIQTLSSPNPPRRKRAVVAGGAMGAATNNDVCKDPNRFHGTDPHNYIGN